MKDGTGFSLVELLVSIVIASILVLTIGVLSSIANSSFNKVNSQQAIYNDLSYGLKLIQNRVRGIQGLDGVAINSATGNWVSPRLIVGNQAFGIYKVGSNQRDFVYLADKSNEAQREAIFSVPDANLNLDIKCDCARINDGTYSCTNLTCATPESVTLLITGSKNKVPFDMESTIYRRNP